MVDYIRDYVLLNDKRFFCKNSGEAYTKKLDVQNLPKSNVPVVQYLGEGNKYINLTLETGGKINTGEGITAEQDYANEKEWLRTFLGTKEGLKVKVVMPDAKSYGCVLMDGKFIEDNMSLNIISFSVKLLIVDFVPRIIVQPNKNALDNAVNNANTILKDNIEYNIPDTVFADKRDGILDIMKRNGITTGAKNVFKKFRKTSGIIDGFIDKTQSKLNSLISIKDKIVTFSQKPSQWVGDLLEINRKVRELANAPGQLYSTIVNTIGRVGVYFGDIRDTLTAVATAFDFTKSEPKAVQNLDTFYRKADTDGIRNVTNSSVLITAYQIAANIDYDNTDDINEVQAELSTMYNLLISDPLLDENTKNAIYDLKIEVDKFLNNLRKNVNNVIIVNITRATPFDTIIFDRYGNLDLYDELIALNFGTITDLLSVSGDIKLYAEQI